MKRLIASLLVAVHTKLTILLFIAALRTSGGEINGHEAAGTIGATTMLLAVVCATTATVLVLYLYEYGKE